MPELKEVSIHYNLKPSPDAPAARTATSSPVSMNVTLFVPPSPSMSQASAKSTSAVVPKAR